MVQWLGLWASTPGGTGSIPGGGTKIPHAMRCSKTNKNPLNQILSLLWFKPCSDLSYPWNKAGLSDLGSPSHASLPKSHLCHSLPQLLSLVLFCFLTLVLQFPAAVGYHQYPHSTILLFITLKIILFHREVREMVSWTNLIVAAILIPEVAPWGKLSCGFPE